VHCGTTDRIWPTTSPARLYAQRALVRGEQMRCIFARSGRGRWALQWPAKVARRRINERDPDDIPLNVDLPPRDPKP
jgi:hypothetical protein